MNQKFECPICHKCYDDLEEFYGCVTDCRAKKKGEEEKLRIEKLNRERESRYREVKAAFKEANAKCKYATEILAAYNNDYKGLYRVNAYPLFCGLWNWAGM